MEETDKKEIVIDSFNREELMRYIGASGYEPEGVLLQLIEQCEEEMKEAIIPKYVYRIFDTKDLSLPGKDIQEHIAGCEKAALMCATVSSGVDRLIRTAQVTNLTKSVVFDCLASVAVEDVCEQVEKIIQEKMPGYHMTWRFGVGYGDFPLEYQNTFLKLVDAEKRIGVHASDTHILIPRKSVTCVVGLSTHAVSKGKRGCGSCNMRDRCQFRKRGERCGL